MAAHTGGDLGLSELLYEKLKRFGSTLTAQARKDMTIFITHTVLIFSVLGPIMTIPQFIRIFISHDAGSLSIWTWGTYLFLSFFWLNYGLLIKNKPIILSNICGLIVNALVVLGIIFY